MKKIPYPDEIPPSEKSEARARTGRKFTVQHRQAELPSESLCSTKNTHHKMQNSVCRMCTTSRGLTRHHLVPESWFLSQPDHLRRVRNAHANIVPLCRPCHDLIESRHPVVRLEARRRLRLSLTQQEVAFAIQIRERGWLDSEYPLVS